MVVARAQKAIKYSVVLTHMVFKSVKNRELKITSVISNDFLKSQYQLAIFINAMCSRTV